MIKNIKRCSWCGRTCQAMPKEGAKGSAAPLDLFQGGQKGGGQKVLCSIL